MSLHTTSNTIGEEHIVSRMSNMQMEDTATITNSASPMLEEIMKMEARLTASITTNRDKEISDMEMRLNANIQSTIDTSIKDALKVMQTSICTAVQNNPLIQSHNLEIKGLPEENLWLNRKVQRLSAEQVKMKRQLNKIETKNLDRSMIIRGITEDITETESSMIEKIHQILLDIMNGDTDEDKLLSAHRIVIKSCKHLGRFNKNRTRPVSVEFQHKEDTDFIIDNRFDLAKGIYVDREYPADTEKKRKTLLPILKAAKRLLEYKRQSRLDDDKLVLKGRPYTVGMLNQLPDELNAFKVTSKEDANTVGFFGEINPLSNFHESPFTHEGTQYISSEQFIQANKAKYFGDLDTYSMILGCTTSLECKILSKQIRNVDDSKWDEVAGAVCYPGIQAKFQQNPYAMDILIRKTGNKIIVECASDRLWATRIPLSDPNCLDDTKWISQGILGQMLESIRNDQINCHSGAIGTQYHQQSTATIHATQVPMAGPNMLQQPSASSMDFSQAISSSISNNHPLTEEPLSGPESASASASSSPTSDTTAMATDTDPSKGPPDETVHA